MKARRALIVVSEQGFHWDELADVFHVFRKADWAVQLASLRGHPKADPRSLRASWVLHSLGLGTTVGHLPRSASWGRPVVESIMRTVQIESVNASSFDAIFFTSTRPDLISSTPIEKLLYDALQGERWIAGEWRLLSSYSAFRRSTLHGKYLDPGWLRLKVQLGLVARIWAPSTQRVLVFRSSWQGRRAAQKLIGAILDHENPGERFKLPEFLDKKSGRRVS